jgi:branched-chain amino acid transport system permease protein
MRSRQPLLRSGLLLLLLLLIPLFVTSTYALQTLSLALQMAIYSFSWMLLAYSGQVSLGHAFFMGVGAYGSTLLALQLLPPLLSLLIGPLFSALFGLAVGYLGARLREWFLGMYTFGLSVIAQTLALSDQLSWLTNGAQGLFPPSLLPSALDYSTSVWFYYLLSASMACACYALVQLLLRSGLGLILSSIHDNERAASSLGVNVRKYRVLMFGLSGYLAGLAGALGRFTFIRYLDPGIFSLENSVWPLLFSVMGGMRYAEGPLLGAMLLYPLSDFLRDAVGGFLALVFFGGILAAVIITSPQGLYALLLREISGMRAEKGGKLGAAGGR